MEILKMLADLRAEREHLEQAILAVERLAAGTRGKRRGRPPKWMSALNAEASAVSGPRTTRVIKGAAGKPIGEAQKNRPTAKKAQAKPSDTEMIAET
jgi:hypothetical protein